MHPNATRLRAVPLIAAQFVAARFTLTSPAPADQDGEDVPIRLLARTGGSIEHPYWGRIIHDMEGLELHKPGVPIDYCHNPDELIGVADVFDASSTGLVAKGRLFGDDPRAAEVIRKIRRGLPYEASINFAGTGLEIEELADGKTVQVNGRDFEGPGYVVRSWPLRGIAVCPYGADHNTRVNLSAATTQARVFYRPAQASVSSRKRGKRPAGPRIPGHPNRPAEFRLGTPATNKLADAFASPAK